MSYHYGEMALESWAAFQYQISRPIVIYLKVLESRDLYLELKIALNFDRHLSSSAVDVPAKFQNDAMI